MKVMVTLYIILHQINSKSSHNYCLQWRGQQPAQNDGVNFIFFHGQRVGFKTEKKEIDQSNLTLSWQEFIRKQNSNPEI